MTLKYLLTLHPQKIKIDLYYLFYNHYSNFILDYPLHLSKIDLTNISTYI